MVPVFDMSTVSLWTNECKDGVAGTSDLWNNPRPGHPVTAASNPLKEWVDRLICDDRRITQRQIAGILDISQECVA